MKYRESSLISNIPNWSLKNKRVFVRIDANVPLSNGAVFDDFRLRAILPTLTLLREKGAKIILGTHIGRPTGYDRKLSTTLLVPWFQQQGFEVTVQRDLAQAQRHSYAITDTLLLLENLRFFPGEQGRDPLFAQQMKELADYYVNDAFAVLHRHDSSVTLLPALFDQSHRTIGLLVERELRHLTPVRDQGAHPYLVIMGGGKGSDKISLIHHFLSKIDTIVICPALCFTFLKAQGYEVGKSIVDEEQLSAASELVLSARQKGVRVILPQDVLIARGSFSGPISVCAVDAIPVDAVGISIGPRTVAQIQREIAAAQTVVFNAAMGFFHRPQTLEATKELLQALTIAQGMTIIGGGESAAAAHYFHLAHGINYISTGGGAALAYLSGQELPGLARFR